MNRFLTALGIVTLLGACSSEGTSPVFSAVKDAIFKPKPDAAATPVSGLTRAKVTANGLAMVRANIEGEDVHSILTATSLNGSYVTYVSAFRQSITMLGNSITATRGLGGDLLSVQSAPNDPATVLIPPESWPSNLTREYRFPGIGPLGKRVSVQCSLTLGAASTITVVELGYDVTTFTETCAGDGVSFTNTYMADKTGQIWKTRQWVGEKVGYLNVEVLEPFTTD